MKKISWFSSLLGASTVCAIVPLITSCSVSNEFRVSVVNGGEFEITQDSTTKGEVCSVLIKDQNVDEAITDIKSVSSCGKVIDTNSWRCCVVDKKTVSIVFFASATAINSNVKIELTTEHQEDVYDDIEILTPGVKAYPDRVIEGVKAEIKLRCVASTPAKFVDSIEWINTNPGSLSTSSYDFYYNPDVEHGQMLTIDADAVHSEGRKISISLVLTNQVHNISYSSSKEEVDVTEVEGKTQITHKGKLNVNVSIEEAYWQTYQIVDVVVKVGDNTLTRSQYTWLIDNVRTYRATITTNDGVEVTDDVQVLVYLGDKTSNLFNVFVTDGALTEESPKVASQIAGLKQEVYNFFDNMEYVDGNEITITAKNPESGKETTVDPKYFHFDKENNSIIVEPGGVIGNLYIKKNLRSTKSFEDISWDNLCHFANGGVQTLQEIFANYDYDTYVGKEKELPFKQEGKTQTVRVIGQEHDTIYQETNSNADTKKAALTFEFANLYSEDNSTTYKMKFSSANNVDSWAIYHGTKKNSAVRDYLNDESENGKFFKNLPQSVQENIKLIIKQRADRTDSSQRFDITDKVFLLTPCEVCGDPNKDKYPMNEGTDKNIQYEWYIDHVGPVTDDPSDARIKKGIDSSSVLYWMSSFYKGTKDNTICIGTNGSITYAACQKNPYAIAPVFCI